MIYISWILGFLVGASYAAWAMKVFWVNKLIELLSYASNKYYEKTDERLDDVMDYLERYNGVK